MNMKATPKVNLSQPIPLALSLVIGACAPATLSNGAVSRQQAAPLPVEQIQAAKMLPAGTVTGLVATFDGRTFVPVVGATVKVNGTAFSAVTNGEGRYAMNGLPAGQYAVSVAKDGMQSCDTRLIMTPVAGTPRVNMAMMPAVYGIKAITPFSATITGVVTDPRGAALAAASVKVLSNVANSGVGSNQTVTADVNGFYTVALTNVAASQLSPGQVQVTSFGVSPGGVKLESTDVVALNLTSSSLVVNSQTKAFTQPGTPSFPNGTFSAPGTVATLQSTELSTRTDEFYVRLTCQGTGKTYDVLPEVIANVTVVAPALPTKNVTFRIPFTMPDPSFRASIIPFGQLAQPTSSSPVFVTRYTLDNLNADLTYGIDPAIADATAPVAAINGGLFVGGDVARFTMRLDNSSAGVSQDIELTGTAPLGSTIAAVTITPSVGPVVTLTAPNVVQPDGTGKWTIKGFNVPTTGTAAVSADFNTPAGNVGIVGKGLTYTISGLVVKMPGANLIKSTPPLNASSPVFSGLDANAFTLVSKTITDDGAANDGVGLVTLVLRPTGANAAAAFKISDTTKTDQIAAASFATVQGAANPLPPAPNLSLGLTTSDALEIKVDGGAPIKIQIVDASWTLETLNAFINIATGGQVTAIRDGAGQFRMTRSAQGISKSIEVVAASPGGTTTALLNKLGISAVFRAGSDGITAEYTGAPVGVTQGVTPTNYSFAGGASLQNANGSVTATFQIVPPAALAGLDTFADDITVTYRMRKGGGASMTLGGGVGAPFGAKTTFFNLFIGGSAPFYGDPSKEQALNKSVVDSAAVPNL